MRTREIALLVVGAAWMAGCKSNEPRGGEAPGKCPATAAALVAQIGDASSASDAATAALAEVRELFTRRCVDDHWSSAVHRCIAAGASKRGHEDCLKKHLTVEQADKVKVVMKARSAELSRERAARNLAFMRTLKDRACACADRTCADGVQAELAAWGEAEARRGPSGSMDAAAQAELTAVANRFAECVMAAATGTAASGSATP